MQKLKTAYVLEGIASSGSIANSLLGFGFAENTLLFHSPSDLIHEIAGNYDSANDKSVRVVFVCMAILNAVKRETAISIIQKLDFPVVILSPRIESEDFDTFLGETNVVKLLHAPLRLDYLVALSYQLFAANRVSQLKPLPPQKQTQLESVLISADHS